MEQLRQQNSLHGIWPLCVLHERHRCNGSLTPSSPSSSSPSLADWMLLVCVHHTQRGTFGPISKGETAAVHCTCPNPKQKVQSSPMHVIKQMFAATALPMALSCKPIPSLFVLVLVKSSKKLFAFLLLSSSSSSFTSCLYFALDFLEMRMRVKQKALHRDSTSFSLALSSFFSSPLLPFFLLLSLAFKNKNISVWRTWGVFNSQWIGFKTESHLIDSNK